MPATALLIERDPATLLHVWELVYAVFVAVVIVCLLVGASQWIKQRRADRIGASDFPQDVRIRPSAISALGTRNHLG